MDLKKTSFSTPEDMKWNAKVRTPEDFRRILSQLLPIMAGSI
jgi:hypothetical protein